MRPVSAAPALAQDFEPAVGVLLQESHRVSNVKQREIDQAIARIKEVEAETRGSAKRRARTTGSA